MNSPIRKTHGFAFMRKHDVAAVVSVLLGARGPLAIAFAVACIVVYAVYGEAIGVSLSHVGNEALHVMPFLTNGYASASVAVVALVCFVVASIHHIAPHGKQRVSPGAMGSYGFTVQAAATSGRAIADGGYVDDPLIASAVAFDQDIPVCGSDLLESRDYNLSAISLTDYV